MPAVCIAFFFFFSLAQDELQWASRSRNSSVAELLSGQSVLARRSRPCVSTLVAAAKRFSARSADSKKLAALLRLAEAV
jgi:hypothetical protein